MITPKKEEIAFDRGYRVNLEGNVFNPKNQIVKGSLTTHGYFRIKLRINGLIVTVKTHRLQAYQKFKDLLYNPNIVVRHINGIKTDNSYINIEIGTHSQNQFDIPKDVRLARSKYASSFLIKYDAESVNNFYNECRSYKKTMLMFNISSKGTLHNIIHNR